MAPGAPCQPCCAQACCWEAPTPGRPAPAPGSPSGCRGSLRRWKPGPNLGGTSQTSASLYPHLSSDLGKGSKKKLPNFGHCPNFLDLPPIRGGLDSKSLDIMKLSWPPHPLEKFGHLGNKSLAFKKAFILLRQKTVCLYRQVELLVYTSTLHFRPSCDNVTMNQEFLQFVPFLSCF